MAEKELQKDTETKIGDYISLDDLDEEKPSEQSLIKRQTEKSNDEEETDTKDKKVYRDEEKNEKYDVLDKDQDVYGEKVDVKGEKIDLLVQRCHEIDLRLQALEIEQAKIDTQSNENNYADFYEQYQANQSEMKDLMQEEKGLKRAIKSRTEKDPLDDLSIWIILYGLIVGFFTFPYISSFIAIDLLTKMHTSHPSWFENINNENLHFLIMLSIIPLALELLTFMLHFVIKKKVNKRVFNIVWIIQSVFTVVMIATIAIMLF
ncbi:MAG: hypothetical protein WCS56_01770 [Bacilli bacterium]